MMWLAVLECGVCPEVAAGGTARPLHTGQVQKFLPHAAPQDLLQQAEQQTALPHHARRQRLHSHAQVGGFIKVVCNIQAGLWIRIRIHFASWIRICIQYADLDPGEKICFPNKNSINARKLVKPVSLFNLFLTFEQ